MTGQQWSSRWTKERRKAGVKKPLYKRQHKGPGCSEVRFGEVEDEAPRTRRDQPIHYHGANPSFL